MLSTPSNDYIPSPGQLCQTFKGKDSVYPLLECSKALIADPLVADELILITKTVHHEELSSYYVEFMKDNRLFYTYFYEQVFCFITDEIILFI